MIALSVDFEFSLSPEDFVLLSSLGPAAWAAMGLLGFSLNSCRPLTWLSSCVEVISGESTDELRLLNFGVFGDLDFGMLYTGLYESRA